MCVSRRRSFWLLAGIVFAAVTVWVYFEVTLKLQQPAELVGGGPVGQSGNLEVGREILDFSSVDLDGAGVTLSQFEDREVVVVDFWATWCQPCIQSMPAVQALNEEFAGHGAVFLAVNVGEAPDRVRRFVEEKEFTVRVVLDEEEEISGAYGIRGIPQLVVVGRDGRVEHIELGYPPIPRQAEAREERLRELLTGLTGPKGA